MNSNMISLDVNVSQVLLGSLFVLFSYWLWKKTKRSYCRFNIPPFPIRPWPVVGHFFYLLWNLQGKLKEWRNTCAGIYSLDTFGQLNIVVNNFKDIKELLVKRANNINNLPHSFVDELLNEINVGILAARDDNWREQRSTSLSILRDFGMGKNIMAEKIETEVALVINRLEALNERPEDVKMLLNIAIANIISSVCVGERFDYNDPYFAQFTEPLYIFAKYLQKVTMLGPVKRLCFLPGDIFGVQWWIKAVKQVDDVYTKPFIQKFKETINNDEEPQSFIAAYLKEAKKMKDKHVQTSLDEANLISTVRALFAAGTNTACSTILWCFLYILYCPEVQEKIYREIEAVVGTERTPNMNDKAKLVYMNAVIMETQRMASIVPTGFQREVSETFEYGGFTFPKGCFVWPILDSVHFDKKIWGDPDNFRPERFLDQNGALINREELIPFSIGPRICLGESQAKMELFLFLSAIFQRFRLEPADKSMRLPSLERIYGTVVFPHNFKLKFLNRKN